MYLMSIGWIVAVGVMWDSYKTRFVSTEKANARGIRYLVRPRITPLLFEGFKLEMEEPQTLTPNRVPIPEADVIYFIWGYYGTQYRVRLYPPFGV